MSIQRYVLLVFITIAALVGLTVQAASSSAFAQFAIQDTLVGGLVSATTLGAVVVGALTLVALLRNPRANTFAGEVVGEMVRVTWPTREETLKATTTVISTTLLIAALLAVYDVVFKTLANWILYTES